jgi:hypothetical protein
MSGNETARVGVVAPASHLPGKVRRRRQRTGLFLTLLTITSLTGCGGCSSQTAAQNTGQQQKAKSAQTEKEKQEKEEKEPLEISAPAPLFSESNRATDDGASALLAKPGHWTTTVQTMQANQENFEGRATLAAVDARGRTLGLPDTSYEMISSRPVLLAEGRGKRVLGELLIPPDARGVRVAGALTASGAEQRKSFQRWALMPSHQYFLVVLAREPASYAFLKVADAVRAPHEAEGSAASPPHYRVVLADAATPLPLPANVLTWTSLAYLVWDEVAIGRLDAAQQQALVDWLHWGGRLIINGPDSLATLRGSFLDKYLPVDLGKARSFSADDMTSLNAAWTPRSAGKPVAAVAVTIPWSGVALKPRPHAHALRGCDGLFYEGAVGAGSIVVSAVQLAERDLVNWPGFDGFLNGALLRRPPRRFRVEDDGMYVGLQTLWAGADNEVRGRDAYFTTPLRWFARDAATRANAQHVAVHVQAQGSPIATWQGGGMPIPETELVVDRPGGLGDWNEFGPLAQAARQSLREAAGVRVPAASFVVICLALYLAVLVPLNWMVFHALERVEWAWIAAPMIAVVGTVAVVRQAQLDIGFVRSQTEIALLELQGDHPRGHLSRYTAVYSSLSTTYDLEYGDDSAVATPFPAERRDAANRPLVGEDRFTVEFEKYDRPRLRGVPVTSASTQLVHSEQMYALAGSLRMAHPGPNSGAWQLENKTGFDLSDAVVIRRRINANGSTSYESCWLGLVRNGASQLLPWTAAYPEAGKLLYAEERVKAAELDYHKRLNVDPLIKLAFRFPGASDPLYGDRDEYRLVARLDEPLPGVVTTPAASQSTGTTVILAHLAYGMPPQPEPDHNAPADVLGDRIRGDSYDEEFFDDESLDDGTEL